MPFNTIQDPGSGLDTTKRHAVYTPRTGWAMPERAFRDHGRQNFSQSVATPRVFNLYLKNGGNDWAERENGGAIAVFPFLCIEGFTMETMWFAVLLVHFSGGTSRGSMRLHGERLG